MITPALAAIAQIVLGPLLRQTNCVFEMTCWPESPMEIFRLYTEVYEFPPGVTLSIIIAIIAGPIIVSTRSVAFLAIIAVYIIALVGTNLAADVWIAPQLHTIVYLAVIAAASIVVIFILKIARE